MTGTGPGLVQAPNPFAAPAAEPVFEMHNLTADPEERHNRRWVRCPVGR